MANRGREESIPVLTEDPSPNSAEAVTRAEGEDFGTVEEELRAGEGCTISRLTHWAAHPEPDGLG